MAALCWIKMTDKQGKSVFHFSPSQLCSGSVERKNVGSVICNVAAQSQESGFSLAGNGYLRSWKWSGPFWHVHSPAGKSNLQQKTERLKNQEGIKTKKGGEVARERWGGNQRKWLHERVWGENKDGHKDRQKNSFFAQINSRCRIMSLVRRDINKYRQEQYRIINIFQPSLYCFTPCCTSSGLLSNCANQSALKLPLWWDQMEKLRLYESEWLRLISPSSIDFTWKYALKRVLIPVTVTCRWTTGYNVRVTLCSQDYQYQVQSEFVPFV